VGYWLLSPWENRCRSWKRFGDEIVIDHRYISLDESNCKFELRSYLEQGSLNR
jgi:hypothetical protein